MSIPQRMGWTLAAAITGFAAPAYTAGAPGAGPPAILSVTPAAALIGTRITLAALDRCGRRRANDQLRADPPEPPPPAARTRCAARSI
jgi:hypothetical protein